METEERARGLLREAALLLLSEGMTEWDALAIFRHELAQAGEEYTSAEWRALDIENGTVPQ
jgi:hypothetical protein